MAGVVEVGKLEDDAGVVEAGELGDDAGVEEEGATDVTGPPVVGLTLVVAAMVLLEDLHPDASAIDVNAAPAAAIPARFRN
jgi:hypothetical protein